ncbi:MAG TPA: hypothetical protein VG944_07675, partial [Fimbriimonas sp.]|nr:hypothetical protein [Fimbriimonas sp.]
MRIAACFLAACLLASPSFGQKLDGKYDAGKDGGVAWQINNHGTLMWGGSPYLPVGVSVDPTPQSIAAAKAAGISDVIVDLPASDDGWDSTISALESSHLRYLIRIGSLGPMAKGIAVDPSSYRISDVKGPKHVELSLPDATEVLAVIAQKRDGAIQKWERVPVINGKLVYDAMAPQGIESVILFYPNTRSLAQPDYWEELDGHRDRLLGALRHHRPGPGLRGIVNPLGKTLTLPGPNIRFVPTSPAFRAEFALFLENKYRNVVNVLRAWSLGSQIVSNAQNGEDKDMTFSFDDVAKFVPLWSGTRGVAQFWDPGKNKLFSCDIRHSTFWKDLAQAVNLAENRRYQRIVDSIREVVDVPVVQEWSGWASPYEGTSPSVDGIGMKASGTSPSAIIATASKATSSLLRWKTETSTDLEGMLHGWLPATDIDLGEGSSASSQLGGVLDDLTSLGARGIFIRTSDPAAMKAVAAEAGRRASDVGPSQYSPRAVFFPENATNPAEAQRLQGGFWWL